MGCFTKFALFVTNFVVFGVGVAVVALASLVISKDNTYGVLFSDGTWSLPIIILVAGLIILAIGFLGCCGAMKGSSCMLYLYAGIVIILLIGELVMGILILVYTNKAEDIFTDGMTTVFNKYGGADKARTKSIDEAQHGLKCCGVYNYTDWANYTYGIDHPYSLANGCCKGELYHNTTDCGLNILKQPDFLDKIYTQGCFDAIKTDVKGSAIGLGVACLILVIVQAISISMACGIAKDVSH